MSKRGMSNKKRAIQNERAFERRNRELEAARDSANDGRRMAETEGLRACTTSVVAEG